MKKKLPAFLAMLLCFALTVPALAEYDIGGGKTLIIYDDGSYKISDDTIDSSFLTGRQYTLDWKDSISSFIAIGVASDPVYSMFKDDVLSDWMLSYFESTGSSMNLIFLSGEEVLLVTNIGNEADAESYDYSLGSGRVLRIYDGEDQLYYFNEDYTRLTAVVDGLAIVFNLVR